MAKKGEKMSEETKRKIGEAQTGFRNHNFGKITPLETKRKMSKSHIGLNTWIKGRKLSEEHKLKISQGNLGKRVSEETITKMRVAAKKRNPSRWLLGKKKKPHTEEVKKRISESRKGKACGKDNYNWKGGIWDRDIHSLFDPRYVQWRMGVFSRDGFECKMCQIKVGLQAHHILPWRDFVELRYDINNGITLCQAHHPRKRAEEKRLIPTFKELVSVSK